LSRAIEVLNFCICEAGHLARKVASVWVEVHY